ncbi:YbgA family protein [Thermodesulfobacteriota bacterium]
MQRPVKIGISACLLGQKVRYDGAHKRDRYLTDTLGQFLDYIPVCPEAECGLGVPREAMRLVGDPVTPCLVTVKTKIEHTDRMQQWAKNRLTKLEAEDLCGFIFKKDSPSSGMERVNVYDKNGMPHKKGVGIFARAFMAHFPLIPVVEEGRLHDPKLRENFIAQIFTLKRWRETLSGNIRLGKLVDFHTRQKLLILSHSQSHYRTMGKLVSGGKTYRINELFAEYEKLLMEALKLKSTVKKNTNVLMHMMGHFKKQTSADEKQELLEIIDQYRDGLVPLIVPITLINHYVRKYQNTYLNAQTYLNPHPIALKLRNHA